MTAEERACCRMMKSDCGRMEMPPSHNCCKKTPGVAHDIALGTVWVSFHPIVAVEVRTPSFNLFPPQGAERGWFHRPEHSPPKSPPLILSSLRV